MSIQGLPQGRPLLRFIQEGWAPVKLPGWLCDNGVDLTRNFSTDDDRMRLAIDLSRMNVQQNTGGPFGSAIFDRVSGILLGVGVNLVEPTYDPTAHGEMTAFRVAGAYVESFSLDLAGFNAILYTSAEPCSMCLGALLWSGVKECVFGATTADVEAINFKEGIKPPLEQLVPTLRDDWEITLRGPLLRDEAAAVLQEYSQSGGTIYNG